MIPQEQGGKEKIKEDDRVSLRDGTLEKVTSRFMGISCVVVVWLVGCLLA